MPATWRSVCLCRLTIHVSPLLAEQIEGTARRNLTVGTRPSRFSKRTFNTEGGRKGESHRHAARMTQLRKSSPWRVLAAIEFPDEPTAARFEKYLKSGSGRAFAKRHFGAPAKA